MSCKVKSTTSTPAQQRSHLACLQDFFGKVFQLWVTEYYSCGCKTTTPSSMPYSMWQIILSVHTGRTIDLALDSFFMAEDSGPASKKCPGSCNQRHGLTSRRICRLPLTCILQLSRVEEVRHCSYILGHIAVSVCNDCMLLA